MNNDEHNTVRCVEILLKDACQVRFSGLGLFHKRHSPPRPRRASQLLLL